MLGIEQFKSPHANVLTQGYSYDSSLLLALTLLGNGLSRALFEIIIYRNPLKCGKNCKKLLINQYSQIAVSFALEKKIVFLIKEIKIR